METDFTAHLLDDDVTHAQALARALGRDGVPTRAFASADAFFRHVHEGTRGCVILESTVAGCSGIDVVRTLSGRGLPIPSIFLVGKGNLPDCVEAMRHGAVDYLEKPAAMDELRESLRRAAILSDVWHVASSDRTLARARLARLSPREREVLNLVLGGRRNKQIAAELDTRESTVKVHRSRLMRKLEARSLAEVLRLAGHFGDKLVEPADGSVALREPHRPPHRTTAAGEVLVATSVPAERGHRHAGARRTVPSPDN